MAPPCCLTRALSPLRSPVRAWSPLLLLVFLLLQHCLHILCAAAPAAPCSAADDGHITVAVTAADAAGGVSLPLPLDVSEADWTLCAFFMHEVHTAADAQTVLAVGAAAGLANDRQLLQLAFASFTEPGFSDWHAPLRLTAADPSTPPFIDLNGVTPLSSVRRWQQFCIRVRSAAVHGAGQGRVQLHAPGVDFTDDEARFVDFQGTNDLYLGSLPDGSQAMPIRFDGLQPAQLLFVFPALAFSHSPFLRTFPHASCFSFRMPVVFFVSFVSMCVCVLHFSLRLCWNRSELRVWSRTLGIAEITTGFATVGFWSTDHLALYYPFDDSFIAYDRSGKAKEFFVSPPLRAAGQGGCWRGLQPASLGATVEFHLRPGFRVDLALRRATLSSSSFSLLAPSCAVFGCVRPQARTARPGRSAGGISRRAAGARRRTDMRGLAARSRTPCSCHSRMR